MIIIKFFISLIRFSLLIHKYEYIIILLLDDGTADIVSQAS